MRLFPILALMALTACSIYNTPENIAPERTRYNEVVRVTEDEQLLSNIVRLRYNDTPFFLDLGSVVVQYGVESNTNTGLNFGIDDFFAGSPGAGSGNIGSGVTISERPTVSYSPLQGESYARRLLTAIPLEVIWLLANSGWSIERLMVLTVERVQNLDNAPTASGPHPLAAPRFADFRELAAITRRLQQSQVLTLTTQSSADGDALLFLFRLQQERDPDRTDDIERLLELLELPPGSETIVLSSAPEQTQDSIEGLIRTRSMLGVLYFIANSIEVPPEHMDLGLARSAVEADGERFDWQRIFADIIEIQFSSEEPEFAFVQTRYRDHWFFIDDRDADSKATFGLLQLLFSLQSTTGSGFLPLLTLPSG